MYLYWIDIVLVSVLVSVSAMIAHIKPPGSAETLEILVKWPSFLLSDDLFRFVVGFRIGFTLLYDPLIKCIEFGYFFDITPHTNPVKSAFSGSGSFF